MSSGFLCTCHGHLSLTNPDGLQTEVRTTLAIGKGNEGYWTVEHVAEQVQTKLIPALEQMHPKCCTAMILFGQSTNHGAYVPDALVVVKMNFKEGGKQGLLRDGW